SRRRHTRWPRDGVQTCALPIFLATLVAILGTTISPYLFFWQASQEVEEEISHGRKRLWQRQGSTNAELRYAFWDVNVGMFFSNRSEERRVGKECISGVTLRRSK